MRQKVMNRHRLPRVGAGRDIRADRILKLQLALLAKLHHHHRGELLGDRTDAELRLRRVRDLPLDVGVPISFGNERLAIACEKDGARESVRLDVPLHVFFDFCRECCRIQAGWLCRLRRHNGRRSRGGLRHRGGSGAGQNKEQAEGARSEIPDDLVHAEILRGNRPAAPQPRRSRAEGGRRRSSAAP